MSCWWEFGGYKHETVSESSMLDDTAPDWLWAENSIRNLFDPWWAVYQETDPGPAVYQCGSRPALGVGAGISMLIELSHTHKTHTAHVHWVSAKPKIAAVRSRWKTFRETCCQSIRINHTDYATKSNEYVSSQCPQSPQKVSLFDISGSDHEIWWHKGQDLLFTFTCFTFKNKHG